MKDSQEYETGRLRRIKRKKEIGLSRRLAAAAASGDATGATGSPASIKTEDATGSYLGGSPLSAMSPATVKTEEKVTKLRKSPIYNLHLSSVLLSPWAALRNQRTSRPRRSFRERAKALRQPQADPRPLHQLQDLPAHTSSSEEEGSDAQAPKSRGPRQGQPEGHLPILDEGGLDHGLLNREKVSASIFPYFPISNSINYSRLRIVENEYAYFTEEKIRAGCSFRRASKYGRM